MCRTRTGCIAVQGWAGSSAHRRKHVPQARALVPCMPRRLCLAHPALPHPPPARPAVARTPPPQSNPFARPFLETLSALDLQQGRASFDNSVYHLHKEVVGQFLSKLKDVVQEYQAVLPAGPAAGAATGQAPAQKGARRRRGGGEAIAAGAP